MAALDPVRSKQSAGAAEHKAKNEPLCYLLAGTEFLHWSASKLTAKRSEAWRGTLDQARACRSTFDAAAGCRAIPCNSIIPTALSEEA